MSAYNDKKDAERWRWLQKRALFLEVEDAGGEVTAWQYSRNGPSILKVVDEMMKEPADGR